MSESRPGRRQPAAGHDRDPAAQRFGVGEDVRAEEHRPPLVAQLEDQRADVAAAERIEPRHRLVEEDHLGIVEERLRDADALDHALRELPQLKAALGADTDAVEQRADALAAVGAGIAEQLPEVVEQLLGGEVVVEVGVLRKVADAPARRDVADRPPENLGAPGRRKDQLHEQLQRGGLAGAVRAEEAEDLARLDVERQAIERAVRARAPEADR